MASSTTKLALRKPDTTDNWSVQDDFNANMEKIDEFAGKVGYFGNVGSISSLSALQDAISSAVGTDYTPRRIMLMFTLGSAFGVFTATGQNHLCQIDVTQQSRWNVLIEQHSDIGNIYRGTNAGGTWTWDKLALNSVINSHFIENAYLGSNQTVTYTLDRFKSYLLIINSVSSSNIASTFIAIVSAPNDASHTGKVTWLTSEPNTGITVTLSGFTFTVASNASNWITIAFTMV